MRPLRLASFVLILLLCIVRGANASTFDFEFTPNNVIFGSTLKASGTFSVSGTGYTGASGIVYSDASGIFVGTAITGIDQSVTPAYNPTNIVFAFLDANGESYLINGPPAAMLSDMSGASLVAGTFSASPSMTVPLPPALPLFASTVLLVGLGRFGAKRWAMRTLILRAGVSTGESLP